MRTIKGWAFGAAFFAVSATALAGQQVDQNVSVTLNPDGSGSASGASGTAYNSTDVIQAIGCEVRAYTGSGGTSLSETWCSARAVGSNWVTCFNVNPTFVQIAASIGPDSDVWFQWNSAGTCTLIDVINSSSYRRK